MKQLPRDLIILMADDDAEDREFAREALEEARVANPMHFVEDGEQLLDYLHRRGAFAFLQKEPLPGLILLDLNMPRMDGREALAQIKKNRDLRQIPVVILTTSDAEEDVFRSYDLGVNSYISKPVDFEGLVDVMKTLGRYWFEIVELPARDHGAGSSPVSWDLGRLYSRPKGEEVSEATTRILLVDDDEEDYFITKDLLSDIRGWNLKLDWARDYDAALAVLASESHDAYLLDYRLGAHDGLALMREVFSHGRGAPVILLTGQDNPDVVVRAMKGGAADFLVKGQISSSLLERSIRYAIERCRVEEQLRQREEHLRLTLDNAPLGLFTCDLDGRLTRVNHAFESITGLPAKRLLGSFLKGLICPEGGEECDHVMRKLIEREVGTGRLDRSFLRADGRQIEVIVTARLMRDAGGRPQQLVGQLEDMTATRHLERQLAQAEKLKSIGQLAAGVAHEINTPTQFVEHNLQFLSDAFECLLEPLAVCRESLGSPAESQGEMEEEVFARADLDFLLEEIPQALEQSLSGIERVSAIVRSVGELVHPDSQTFELVDLNRAVEAAVLLTTNRWKHIAIVKTELDRQLPRVACVPGAINQVLVNLLVNAAEAITGSAKGRDQAQGEIRIRTQHTEGWVEFHIVDDGSGIPAEIQPRIFDPFYTTKEVGQATGQGLAIAHNIVTGQHKGRILVDSEDGKGTTFRVLLPLAVETQETADAQDTPGAVASQQ